MKFKINTRILSHNLNHVSRAISLKSPIPVLSGILFDVKEEGLTIIGSDSEVSIKIDIPVSEDYLLDIEQTGSIVLNSKYVLDIIKKIDEDNVSFEILDGEFIKISTNKSVFNLNGISATEYPKIDMNKTNNPISFEQQVFKTIIDQTVFAVSLNENRPILTGINFNINGDLLLVNSTDSYRLSHKRLTLDEAVDIALNIVIPGKSLNELSKMISGNDPIEMHIFNNKVLFTFNNVVFQSRLLEGTYPDTSKLIPLSFDFNIVASSYDLVSSIDRASLIAKDRSKNVVKLSTDSKTEAKITSNAPEIGKVVEDVVVDKDIDNDFTISFSAKYMIEAIKSLKCEEVKVSFNGDMKPFIIKNVDDDSVIQLVLPVRTY